MDPKSIRIQSKQHPRRSVMFRTLFTIVVAAALAALLTGSVLAAEPAVSKRVMTEDDGTAVLVVEVRAASEAIYGITVLDESASISDIVAPKGWSGISSGDRVVFATVDKPVEAGGSVVFRLVTTNKSAPLRFSFRDAKSLIYSGQTI
jgi:hypothetical protein